VASATVTVGRLTLADGRITVRMLRAPMLTARMVTGSEDEVQYQPAFVEVSGRGITTKQLSAAGDSVNISLGDDERSSESMSLGGLPSLHGLSPAGPLALPSVPGLPSLGTPDAESAPAVGTGTTVRISLGDAHQATGVHAVAVTAAAIRIAISGESASDNSDSQGHNGYGDGRGGSSIVAEMDFGVLAAAVAPDSPIANSGVTGSGVTGSGVTGSGVTGSGVTGSGVTGSGVTGSGGGLPVTGPQAGLIAISGAGLLIAGGAALFITRRRRRRSPRSSIIAWTPADSGQGGSRRSGRGGTGRFRSGWTRASIRPH
jgi:LPXTG-motif cell wall-anchored protein